jgi:hypothetical protein
MTAHLLLVTLGPVQDFIAQARRTRDLWYGSHLLSELGRAAARVLADGGLDFDDLDVSQAWPDAGLMGFIYVFVREDEKSGLAFWQYT